jgi:hypothetical protein
MKKLFVAILAILYMGTSTGVTVELHYCMGKLVEWTLGHNDNSLCGNCGMEKKSGSASGCCKDEYKQLKIDKDQKRSVNIFQLNETLTEATPINLNFSILYLFSSPATFTKINAPPPGCGIPLTLLNCIFRI